MKNTNKKSKMIMSGMTLIVEAVLMMGLILMGEQIPLRDWLVRIVGVCLMITLFAQSFITARTFAEAKNEKEQM